LHGVTILQPENRVALAEYIGSPERERSLPARNNHPKP
jgi:hypothetical protein